MFNRGIVLRFLAQARKISLNRFSSNSGLSLAVLLFAVLLTPSSGWASTTKNCPTEPAQGVAIASGVTFWGSNCVLNTAGDLDSFQFTAAAGDTWSMVLGDGQSPTTSICLTLLPPGSTGNNIFFECTNGTAFPAVVDTQKLTVAGTYTIEVTETNTATMTYGLSLERLSPAPPDGTQLILNKNISAEVNPPTAQDPYTFSGVTTDTYKITLSDTGASTCFSVYGPTGTAIVSANCTNGTAIPVVSSDVTPAQNGTYVVVVYTDGNDATINYSLELACVAGPDGCKQPPPTCVLKDSPTYNATSGTLTMSFTIGTPAAVTWNGWLVSQGKVQSLWSQAEPVTEPAVSVTKTQASVAKAGVDGVLSTLTVAATATSPGGITCSSWALVNTK